jgi:hypothetical protein
MSIAVVLNTCAMQPGADLHAGQSGVPYSKRVDFIQSVILPRLIHDPLVGSICIAGEFAPSPEGHYDYVPVSSAYHNCRDVLAQRQAGWDKVRRAAPQACLFLMDDHVPDGQFFERLQRSLVDTCWDVYSPNRRSRTTGQLLNSGWNGVGAVDSYGAYAHTHGIALTPKALALCPWGGLTPIYHFDVLHDWWFSDRKLFVATDPDTFVEDLEE